MDIINVMSLIDALKPAPGGSVQSAIIDLQSSLDLESFWQACVRLIESRLPHRSCSLMFNIVDFEPADARHHVVKPRNPDYVPATSLTVSGPFLAKHPLIRLYTYSQIVSEDPDASWRRLAQEPDPEWTEFVHLAFWREQHPEAVLSIHRPPDCPQVSDDERAFLEELYPMVEASLRRLRAVESAQFKRFAYENYLQRLPLALMFIDAEGELLFSTAAAEKQCGRWNRGFASGSAATRCAVLPEQIGNLLEGTVCEPRLLQGRSGRAASLKIRHPSIPGLAVKIDVCSQTPALQSRPCYVLTFVDDLPAEARTPEPSQGSLLALQQLSPSERRVALLVAKGLRNEEVAEHLHRSPRTIEFQLNSIYRKLSLSSRTQLVRSLS